ncbi:MAG: sulfite exporter TauE/SafE family protein [Planctomycetota bacterium]
MLLEFPAFLLIGAVAGFLAGLLGIGGGLIIVPALAALLMAETPLAMQVAVATSLASILFTGSASVHAHHRHGAVSWPLVLRLSPGLVVGSVGGAMLATILSGRVLMGIFGLFCIVVGARMLLKRRKPSAVQPSGTVGMIGAGGGIGAISALVGIGGGTLTVPYLVRQGISIHVAVATSAACGLPIAAAGLAGFIVAGWQRSDLPELTLGFVWWPALLGLCLTSIVAAPWGARVAHRAPRERLQGIFGVFLSILGVYLAGRALLD